MKWDFLEKFLILFRYFSLFMDLVLCYPFLSTYCVPNIVLNDLHTYLKGRFIKIKLSNFKVNEWLKQN